MKRNDVLIQVVPWMNLESIMLSEREQTQKATYYVNPHIRKVQNREIYNDRKLVVVKG